MELTRPDTFVCIARLMFVLLAVAWLNSMKQVAELVGHKY